MRYFTLSLKSIIVIGVILLSSCHEERMMLKKWDTYEIKKGNHYSSGIHFMNFDHQQMSFDAVFDESAIYKTDDPKNQSDINKLFGFSDIGENQPHENSARFGWVWSGEIDIYAYCYADGKASHKFITSVKPNEVNRYMIKIERNKYKFLLAGKEVEMESKCNDKGKYILFPYFGGSEKSSQNITIKLKYLS